jgi:hypothetical protein
LKYFSRDSLLVGYSDLGGVTLLLEDLFFLLFLLLSLSFASFSSLVLLLYTNTMKFLTCAAIAVLTTGCFFQTFDLVQAQEGSTTQTSSAPSAYSCDPATCQLANNCLCASSKPPNGLDPKDTPQFVVVTFDDSVQEALHTTAKQMLDVT